MELRRDYSTKHTRMPEKVDTVGEVMVVVVVAGMVLMLVFVWLFATSL